MHRKEDIATYLGFFPLLLRPLFFFGAGPPSTSSLLVLELHAEHPTMLPRAQEEEIIVASMAREARARNQMMLLIFFPIFEKDFPSALILLELLIIHTASHTIPLLPDLFPWRDGDKIFRKTLYRLIKKTRATNVSREPSSVHTLSRWPPCPSAPHPPSPRSSGDAAPPPRSPSANRP